MGRVHPHAGRADLPDRQQVLRLGLRVRARAGPERPPHLPRPGQGARRLQQHQRDDLPARQPAGLRALGGGPGHGRLGLRALPAVLQEDGDLPGRGGRVPGRRRPARAGTGAGHQPAVPGVLRRRAAGRVPADRRRERLPAGRLRRLRPEHPPRPPAQRGPGLPAPGDEQAQPRGDHPRLRHQDPLRGRAGGGRGVPAGRSWPGRGRPRREPGPAGPRHRDHPVRRRDQHPAAAPAVRRGPGRAAARAGHPRGRRPARRGREPAGPPRGVRPVRVEAAGVGGARAQVAQPARGRRQVALPAQRPRRHQPLRGRRLHPQQRRGRLPEPHVPLPADRHPLRRLVPGGRPRVSGARRADVLRLPRLGPDHLARSRGSPGAAVQLPVHPGRPP